MLLKQQQYVRQAGLNFMQQQQLLQEKKEEEVSHTRLQHLVCHESHVSVPESHLYHGWQLYHLLQMSSYDIHIYIAHTERRRHTHAPLWLLIVPSLSSGMPMPNRLLGRTRNDVVVMDFRLCHWHFWAISWLATQQLFGGCARFIHNNFRNCFHILHFCQVKNSKNAGPQFFFCEIRFYLRPSSTFYHYAHCFLPYQNLLVHVAIKQRTYVVYHDINWYARTHNPLLKPWWERSAVLYSDDNYRWLC